jgi:hypothetical protein
MKTMLIPVLATIVGLLRSRAVLHLELLALPQKLAMVAARDRRPLRFRRGERLFWVWLYHIWPGCLETLALFKAEILVRWHREGFRLYWTWKARRRSGGRPTISPQTRALIRRLSQGNPLRGAPRVHGELQMLGINAFQTTVPTATVHILHVFLVLRHERRQIVHYNLDPMVGRACRV